MSVSMKEKELAAVGISVAAGCKPCTAYHVSGARKAGATDAEITKSVNDAHRLRTSATELMREHGLGQSRSGEQVGGVQNTDRVQELLAVGVAFAVNCTSSLKQHLKAAETVGITAEDTAEIVTLARFIKGMAASHVEKLVEVFDVKTPEGDSDPSAAHAEPEKPVSRCGC